MKLNPRQLRFVAEYLVDLNATQAALRAGYAKRSARQAGAAAMSNPAIAKAIAVGKAKQLDRLELSADKVLAGIARVAFFDIADAYDPKTNKLKPVHELPRAVRDAVAGIEVHHELGEDEVGVTVKLKLLSRLEALRDLGKHLELFTEKHKHELDGSIADLLREARARAQRR